MKKIIKIFSTFFILLFYNCATNKNVKIFYEVMSNQTNKNLKYEKWYYENTPEEYFRNDDEILLFFNGQAFKGTKIIVDKKDTLVFEIPTEPLQCLGFKMYKVNKNKKHILIETSEHNKKLKLTIEKKYRYVTIGKSFEKPWGITYYPFFPNIACI